MQPLLRRKAARLDYALYSHFPRLACTLPALLLRHILPKWMLIMLVYNAIPIHHMRIRIRSSEVPESSRRFE